MAGVIRLVHASRPGDLAVPYGATHSTNSGARSLAPPGAGSDSGTTDTDRAGDVQEDAGSITFDTYDVGESASPLPTAEGAPTVAALGRKHTDSTWDYQMPALSASDKADLKALERSVSQRERPAERVQSTYTSRRGSNDMSRAGMRRPPHITAQQPFHTTLQHRSTAISYYPPAPHHVGAPRIDVPSAPSLPCA